MHIDKARAKAAAVGVACDLRVADMFDLPADLTGLNLVCIPLGGICWPPDIDAWARVVAERLRPGGRVLTSERHPIWEVVTVSREQLADRTG